MDICINCPQCDNLNIYHIFEQHQATTIDFICKYCNSTIQHTILPININENIKNINKEPPCVPICIPVPCSIL